ncbi:selenoprotein S-like [Oscarella lobularis]|uniref:selenoprotein S-like n=1 Tax=Oscarella lobularis TaxID=121494 RepID=UPI0033133F4B
MDAAVPPPDSVDSSPPVDKTPSDHQHPNILVNTTPEIVTTTLTSLVGILEQYGWFILIGAILAYIVWTNYLRRHFIAWKYRIEEQPRAYSSAHDDVLAVRARMQAQLDKKAADHAIKRKEIEEAKRLEKIEDWERHQRGGGYRSKGHRPPESSSDEKKPPPKKRFLQSGYNPLMGHSSGSSFRPQRRRGGGQGGG